MGSTPKPPKPPDPTQTANAQWGFTKQAGDYTANVNAQNLYTPFGSVTYERNAAGVPIGQRVSLNDQDQNILNNQRGIGFGLTEQALAQMRNMPQNQFSLGDIGREMPGSTNYQDWGDRIAKNSYEQRMALMRPDIEQGRSRLEQRFADQGLPQTGEAAQGLSGSYERNVNNLYNQAAGGALQDAGNEMSRLQGLQSNAWDTALNAKLMERQMPFNELAMYLNATPQSPYQSAQPLNPVNYMPSDFQGAQANNYAGQMDAYKAKMAQNAAQWGAVGSLFGKVGEAAIGKWG